MDADETLLHRIATGAADTFRNEEEAEKFPNLGLIIRDALIEYRAALRALEPVAESASRAAGRPPYPEGIVNGPCVCGSWPGGECLKCEWTGQIPLRTFTMYRRNVPSETHNENQRNAPDEPQFEGVVFSDGRVAIRWLTAKRSTSTWDSMDDMLAIHGHPEYGSELVWNAAPLPSGDTVVVTEAMVDAVMAFERKASYLQHPDVRPFRGQSNGDSIEAWEHDYITALCKAMLSAAPATAAI